MEIMNNKFFNIFLSLTFLFEQSFGTLVVSKNKFVLKNKFDTIFEFDSDLESNSAAFDEYSSNNKKIFNAIFQKNNNGKVGFIFNKNNKKVKNSNSKLKIKNNNSDNSGNDSESTDDGENYFGMGYGLSSGGQRKAIEDKNGKFLDQDGNQIDLNKSYVFYKEDEDYFDNYDNETLVSGRLKKEIILKNEKLKEQEEIELELKYLDKEINILKKELGINNKNKFYNNIDHNNGNFDNETLIGGRSRKEIKENLKIINKKKEMQNKKLFNQKYYQELNTDKNYKTIIKRTYFRKMISIEDYKKKFNNEKIEERNNFKKIGFDEVVKVQNFELDREERKLNRDDFVIIKNRDNEFKYRIKGDNKNFYYDVTINNKENKIYLIRKIYHQNGRNSKVNDEVVWIGEENYYNGEFLGINYINNKAIMSFILEKEKENKLEKEEQE